MGRHCYGQIVYVRMRNRQNKIKERTAVIIDSDAECDAGSELLVVAISSKFGKPIPDFHISVHESTETDPITGLNCPCVAKCNFIDYVDQSNVRRIVGQLPDKLLERIVEMFDKLCSDETFAGWQ